MVARLEGDLDRQRLLPRGQPIALIQIEPRHRGDERAVGASSVLDAPRDMGFGAAVAMATAAFAHAPGLASTRSDSGAVVAAGIDRNEPLHRPALRLDRVQGRGQPTSAVMGNEHRCDDVTGADQMVVSVGR